MIEPQDVPKAILDIMRPSIRISTAAASLEVNSSTIHKMIRQGDIQAHYVGKRGIRIFVDSLRDYQERNKVEAQPVKQDIRRKGATWQSRAHKEAMASLRSRGVL